MEKQQTVFLWCVSSLPSPPESHSCFYQDVELIVLPPAEENWA